MVSMMEKIFLAIAIACSLYLNIQIKPQPRVLEAGVGYPTESLHQHQPVVMMTI
jgi:hypothetical protein